MKLEDLDNKLSKPYYGPYEDNEKMIVQQMNELFKLLHKNYIHNDGRISPFLVPIIKYQESTKSITNLTDKIKIEIEANLKYQLARLLKDVPPVGMVYKLTVKKASPGNIGFSLWFRTTNIQKAFYTTFEFGPTWAANVDIAYGFNSYLMAFIKECSTCIVCHEDKKLLSRDPKKMLVAYNARGGAGKGVSMICLNCLEKKTKKDALKELEQRYPKNLSGNGIEISIND